MSTPETTPDGTQARPALRPVAERGATTVADRVIEKIAAQAAAEVTHTAELGRRLSDRLPGRGGRHARADALISGRLVQFRVAIGVAYPTSIVSVTRAVRTHVSETVGRLCDLDVRDVDVEVTKLRRSAAPDGRRVI